MFCPKCHTNILDESIKFCSRCGEDLTQKKKKSSFSSFSTLSTSSTFKYMSKYGKKTSLNKYNHENINKIEIPETTPDNTQCNINQPIENNNHNDQFNYSIKYSGVTKKSQGHDEQFNYSKKYSNVTKKGKTHDEQYAYSQRYSNSTTTDRNYSQYNQQDNSSDDSYRLAFINYNKDSIIKSSFSIPALLFGPLYLIYRKMIPLGIALQIIILILRINLGDAATYFQILIHIILAFKFRTIYLNYVDKNVKQIKEKGQNKTTTEIAYECTKKGSTLGLKGIIKYVIIFYILTVIAVGIYEVNKKSVDINPNSNNQSYNNSYTYEINNYEFEISTKLTQTTLNEYQFIPDNSNNSKCVFQLEYTPSNNTVTRYLLDQSNRYPAFNESTIKTERINDKYWYSKYFYPQVSNDYVRIDATKDYSMSEIYSITTLSYNTNTCENITQEIINNFKKKNY